ncbi:hypothetical protein [Sphingobium amiense]|uniref:hypothetical protein n=2 Tax=Sphingobium amiense TaxID=135719 RepID=UPI001E48ACDB|nr:hypothetical protein [Sphingobium amiense]
MTGHTRLIRPAGAAIAAVLAFHSTPMIAQVIVPPPVEPAPAPVADPVGAATPATPQVQFTPTAPVVQQTAPVEERIAAATAASEAERAAPARSPVRQAQVAKPAPVAPSRNAEAPAPAPVTAASPQEAPATIAPARAEPAPTMAAEATPAATVASDPGTQQSLLWALGGGVLVLVGLGGAALARRRRTSDNEAEFAVDEMVTEPTPVAPASSPAHVSARPVRTVDAHENSVLESMVAAPPSAENPFATRTKRMRRAKFLLAQQAAPRAAEPHMAPQTTHAEPAFAAAPDRSQTVYRFGADTGRSGFLKPRTR